MELDQDTTDSSSSESVGRETRFSVWGQLQMIPFSYLLFGHTFRCSPSVNLACIPRRQKVYIGEYECKELRIVRKKKKTDHTSPKSKNSKDLFDDEDSEDLFDDPSSSSFDSDAEIDETYVMPLPAANFSSFLAECHHILVEFYAPWCGHCQALTPDYNATEDTELAEQYCMQGFPTLLFFVDGVHKEFSGERTMDAIVAWITKKLGPGVQNVTTVDKAERTVTGDDTTILAFLDSLSGVHSDELAAASRMEDTVNFYQTASPDVAKLFHINPEAKRLSVVLLKKEKEKLTVYGFMQAVKTHGKRHWSCTTRTCHGGVISALATILSGL